MYLLPVNVSADIICFGTELPAQRLMGTWGLQGPSFCVLAGLKPLRREDHQAHFTRNFLNLQEETAGGHTKSGEAQRPTWRESEGQIEVKDQSLSQY